MLILWNSLLKFAVRYVYIHYQEYLIWEQPNSIVRSVEGSALRQRISRIQQFFKKFKNEKNAIDLRWVQR